MPRRRRCARGAPTRQEHPIDDEKSAWFKRTEYDRTDSETRAALVAAAADVFAEVGYAKASIARITEAAGVSRATFYVYFSTRREILEVLAQELAAQALVAQRQSGTPNQDAHEIISGSIRTVLELYTSRASLLSVIDQQAKHDPEVLRVWNGFWQDQIDRSQRFIDRLVASGHASPAVDSTSCSEVITTLLFHYAVQDGRTHGDDLQATAARMTAIYERLIGLTPGKVVESVAATS